MSTRSRHGSASRKSRGRKRVTCCGSGAVERRGDGMTMRPCREAKARAGRPGLGLPKPWPTDARIAQSSRRTSRSPFTDFSRSCPFSGRPPGPEPAPRRGCAAQISSFHFPPHRQRRTAREDEQPNKKQGNMQTSHRRSFARIWSNVRRACKKRSRRLGARPCGRVVLNGLRRRQNRRIARTRLARIVTCRAPFAT